MNGIEIVSTGYAKIEKTLDNQQLEQMVETSNEDRFTNGYFKKTSFR